VNGTIWKIPTNDILTRFASMPTNLVVVGTKRLYFAYAKNEIKTYSTGLATSIFKWDQLLKFLELSLKRHATIGSNIIVIHHEKGYLGTVRKFKRPNSFFQPINVT
jgi:hypothetical protein